MSWIWRAILPQSLLPLWLPPGSRRRWAWAGFGDGIWRRVAGGICPQSTPPDARFFWLGEGSCPCGVGVSGKLGGVGAGGGEGGGLDSCTSCMRVQRGFVCSGRACDRVSEGCDTGARSGRSHNRPSQIPIPVRAIPPPCDQWKRVGEGREAGGGAGAWPWEPDMRKSILTQRPKYYEYD